MKSPAKQLLATRVFSAFILILAATGMISTANAQFATLHEFAGGYDDGRNPYGGLTPSGSTLYGMTPIGGSNDYGVIFRINTNGSNYINMHAFAGGSGDGKQPLYGALVEIGSYYYGMTSKGGINGNGVVFRQLIPEPGLGIWIVGLLVTRCIMRKRRSE